MVYNDHLVIVLSLRMWPYKNIPWMWVAYGFQNLAIDDSCPTLSYKLTVYETASENLT